MQCSNYLKTETLKEIIKVKFQEITFTFLSTLANKVLKRNF